MSEANVEVVLSGYEAWNSGDLDALLALMDPEIDVDYTAGVFPGVDQMYEGHEG